MANEGRLEPIDNDNFRVFNSADQVVGAIEKSEHGFQPMHAQGEVGPVFPTPEEAMAHLLDELD